jgi:predicted RNA methylase
VITNRATDRTNASRVRVPDVGPDTVYCTLYQRDPGFFALAEAELSALVGGHAAELGVWLSSTPVRWATCGYAKAGGRQLAYGRTLDDLRDALAPLGIVAPRFSIATRRLPRRFKGASAAKTLIGDCIEGDVVLEDPELRLLLVVSAEGYRVLIDEDATPGEADWLRGSHKPHNYLVAIPVRIAKAMLNITARPGDSVLDPFCGSGTIPLLAAWAGHTAYGSDIGATCVARATENVAHFGQTVTFACSDARDTEQDADCIVSNLPYGVYCHLERDALAGVLANLARRAARVTLVTSEHIEDALVAHGYTVERVIPVESLRFERFVYVTRSPRSTDRARATDHPRTRCASRG